jgi:hypothetical protein
MSALHLCFLISVATMVAAPAFACRSDRDCPAPDRCHFAQSTTEGMCLNTSGAAIQRAVKAPHSIPLAQRNDGDVCQFTVDCAVGAVCFKSPGGVEGLCYAPAPAAAPQRRLKQ